MSQTSLVYSNEKMQKTQPRQMHFIYQITGAKTNSPVPVGAGSYTAYDAIASQAVIDAYLGTSSEFNYLAFDATAMGANEFAVVMDMKGQCGKILGAKIEYWSADGATMNIALKSWPVTTLTNSTAANECAVGAYGNVAVKFKDVTGLDAATDGYLIVTIDWIAK